MSDAPQLLSEEDEFDLLLRELTAQTVNPEDVGTYFYEQARDEAIKRKPAPKPQARIQDFDRMFPGIREQGVDPIVEHGRLRGLFELAEDYIKPENIGRRGILQAVPEDDRKMFLDMVNDLASRQAAPRGVKFETKAVRAVAKGVENMWENLKSFHTMFDDPESPIRQEIGFGQQAENIRRSYEQPEKSPLSRGLLSALEMAPKMLVTAASAPFGAPGVVASTNFWITQITPQRFQEYTEQGMSPRVARAAALTSGIVEAAIEQLEMWGLRMKGADGAGGLIIQGLKAFGKETIVEEGLQAASGSLFKALGVALSPGAKPVKFREELRGGIHAVQESFLAMPWLILPGLAGGAFRTFRGPDGKYTDAVKDQLSEGAWIIEHPKEAAQIVGEAIPLPAAFHWAQQNPEEAADLAKKPTLSRSVMDKVFPGLRWSAEERAQFHTIIKKTAQYDDAMSRVVGELTSEEVRDAIRERGPEEIPTREGARVGEEVEPQVRVPTEPAAEGVPEAVPGEAPAEAVEAELLPDPAKEKIEVGPMDEGKQAWQMTQGEYRAWSLERTSREPLGPERVGPEGLQTKKGSVFHGALGDELLGILERGEIRTRLMDDPPGTEPESVVSMSRFKAVPQGPWIIELKDRGGYTDRSELYPDRVEGKAISGLELRSAEPISIDDIKEVSVQLGTGETEQDRDILSGLNIEETEALLAKHNIPLRVEKQLTHRQLVERAVAEGKPVPPEVLAEYPDIAPRRRLAAPEEAAPARKSLADYAQKITPEVPVAVAPTVEREAVLNAFPGTQVTRLPQGAGFRVELPSGQFFEIRGKADIPVDWEAAEAAAGRTFTQAERDNLAAAGAVQLNLPDGTATDGMGVILISQRIGQKGLIRHEALHLARQAGFFNENEWNALVKKYSNETKPEAQQEEDVANTRYVQHKARSLWTQLKTWFRKLLDTLGLKAIDAKSVESLMESSAFWARRPDIRGGQQAQSLVQRPDLAIPTVTPEARGLVEERDVARAEVGVPAVRPDAEVQAEAETRLNADYEGEVQRLKELANRGGQLSDVDTLIAKTILNREATQAVQSNDPVKLKDAMALIDSYRRTGTEQARAFRQRYDPVESPLERRTRMLNEALLTPNRADKESLDAAHGRGDMAEVERIRDKTVKDFDKMRQGLLDMDIDINDLGNQLQDPESAARALGSIRAAKADIWDAMYEFWANSILSSPTTHAANMIGNFTHSFWHFTAERFSEAFANTFIKAPTGAQWGEFRHILAGIIPGLTRGARNFARTWKTELPYFEAELGRVPTTKLDTPNIAISGKWGKAVRTMGYRLLLAADELAKGLIAEMEVGAQAYRMAKGEGLQGEALADRMMNLVNDTQSEAWSAAINTAVELTFQKRGGKPLEAVLNIRRKIPGVRYIIPFVTTPMNIFKFGIRKSPFGTIPLGMKVFNAVKTNNWSKVPTAAAEQILAWGAVLLLLANNEDEPWITGAVQEKEKGPRELGRRTFPAQSVRFGDTWYSYARLEPFATTIGLTVDTLNAVKSGQAGKMLTLPYKALVGQVKDKTFLRGLGDMVNMVEDPKPERVAQWASSFAVSWIPNVARAAGRATTDNYPVRGVWGKGSEWWKRLGKRTLQRTELGLVQDQPAYDLWGRPAKRTKSPMPYTDWLWRFTLPIRTKEEDIFIGDRLILNWNFQNPEDEKYPVSPAKYYTKQGKRIYWTDEQYTDFVRIAGEIAREAVEDNIGDRNPDKPKANDIEWLRRRISQARRIAKRRVLSKK